MREPLIRMRGLRAGYGARKALGPLSLDLGKGETSVLIGPGGAGKSTLLRILSGTPAAASDFWCRGVWSPVGAGARLLPQKPPAPPATLRERLGDEAGLELPAETAVGRVWASLPEASKAVTADLDTPLGALPQERLRLALLTLTLAGEPPFAFLDEPEADLDEPWHTWVRRLVVAWRGRTTLLLATHHLELAREGADHIVLLVGGRVVEAAAAETLFEHPVHPRTREYLRLGS